MDIKTLCLGVLNRGDATGYEIKKAFEEGPFGHIHVASFGAIYPALSVLSAAGMVVGRDMPQDKRPDKRIYSITESGRRALMEALMAPPDEDKVRSDVLFILFFAHLLPVARLTALIDQRIVWYRNALERMESGACRGDHAGERFVHGLGLAVYRAAADYLTSHREALLDEVSAPDRLVAE